ncbi:MipA/OmpV family protein [Massilia antarctica]|uniref:MipA/OmpV family protein n=1 Tax=Massilia antarctica TaxID=2765360 RepID=UPI0006BB932D|nr:MipA/OmpV family protein [Massilia sp. H27-R4]MCY0913015.1 MipA/OmpV family protein [Massilia sp. H27-R4]CUI07596.1 putative outer membrane protein [Janthinobacterium sp. CG23_2]CUU31382.1 putative outer membrane protein [Janthinobacterium sp. CG23_2]
MKLAVTTAATLLAFPIIACAVPAENTPLPLWEAGVLGGVASAPAYPGAADRSSRGLVLPFLIYRGLVLRADQTGIGARLFKREAVELDVGLAGSLPARSDDVAARAGMPNLGLLLEFGPRLKVRIAEPSASSRIRLDIPLRAVIEARAGMRTQGFTFEPKVVYEMRSADGLWTFDANAGVAIGDKKVNRYFYEVQPRYATSTRPAYQAGAGLMLARVGASASRMLNDDVRVLGFVRLESYAGAANEDSPLMKKKSGASAGVAFAWTLGRSTRLAGD